MLYDSKIDLREAHTCPVFRFGIFYNNGPSDINRYACSNHSLYTVLLFFDTLKIATSNLFSGHHNDFPESKAPIFSRIFDLELVGFTGQNSDNFQVVRHWRSYFL